MPDNVGSRSPAWWRDPLLGVIMALAVALVPNVLSWLVEHVGAITHRPIFADKLWLVFFLAAGAALLSPAWRYHALGASPPSSGSPTARWLYPVLLVIAGVCASAYFIVVVGWGAGRGWGPGLAETLDSSLAPCMYAVWSWSRRTASISRRAVSGAVLVLAGLLAIAFIRRPGNQELLLLLLGVGGAVGTTFALWLLRQLVRTLKAGLGFAVACRYGGVAVVFLLMALLSGDHHLDWRLAMIAFACGAVLINGAFFAAVNIDSDLATAASMGLIPLFALGLEAVFSKDTTVPFQNPVLWVGMVLAMVGIVLLQGDRSTKG